ncbi:MAG: HAMP domain-containing histidine kinase [Lachnospiraceae bacterium]|nr:HAMP domain-containing histidine kinase [Lachnospiraceae bacterium]
MKVSTQKKSLPGVIRIMLLCVQHLCAAFMAVMLAYMVLSIGIVGKGLVSGERYYTLNPFENANSFEESSTFYNIFEDYTEKVALGSVISSQFGTTGEIEGTTPIDIVVYANRKNGLKEQASLSATYKLDDLLKWGMYGITYETYNIESLEDIYRVFPEQKESTKDYTYIELYDMIYQSAIVNQLDCWNYVGNENHENPCLAITIPVERYQMENGLTLKELATNWSDYLYLVGKLKSSVYDLSINFENYQQIHRDLMADSTNFRFCVIVNHDNGETSTFTNFTDTSNTQEYYTKHFESPYFIWNRSTISYDTNMSVNMYEYVSSVFKDYEYALGENVQIYFTVDDSYAVADAFQMGMHKFVVTKDIWLYIGIAVTCALIWILLLLYLSVMTGRKKVAGETQIVLNWFDYVPTEIAAFICAVVGVAIIWGLVKASYSFGDFMNWYTYQEDDLMLLGVCLTAGALSVLFTFFWYSMLRRFKAHIVLKHSLIFRFLAWFYRGIKKIVVAIKVQIQYIYNNGSDASKVMWPAVLLMILHFIVVPIGGVLVVEGFDYGNAELFVGLIIYGVLFVMDAAVAFAILKNKVARTEIIKHIQRIARGEMDIRLDENQYKGENNRLANAVNNIGNGIKTAVETSMKDERMKADLITNVSHDIKTPLTSIINYVDLLKRENIETEPVKGYIEVLDAKSQRLKQLTDDLVEASKISSGNIVLQMERINLAVLLKQSLGEFSEKFESKRLTILENYGDGEYMIYADSRRMWRVIENLFNNIYKYALDGTRVYVDLTPNKFNGKRQVLLSIKNISANQLNVRPDELTERFVRGDDSRTTEGSGLGLSIAKSLVEAQGGSLNIILDGDLFKIVILFEESVKEEEIASQTTIMEVASEKESE